jgi:hypothetical protein
MVRIQGDLQKVWGMRFIKLAGVDGITSTKGAEGVAEVFGEFGVHGFLF